jgi:L-amino acid N-acyltransferase YncA
VIAIIAVTDDPVSIELHRKLGFREAGRLEAVGFKRGRWWDTVLMQRSLG